MIAGIGLIVSIIFLYWLIAEMWVVDDVKIVCFISLILNVIFFLFGWIGKI